MGRKTTLFVGLAIATIQLQGCEEPPRNMGCDADCTTVIGRFTTDDGNTGVKELALKLVWRYDESSPYFQVPSHKIAITETDESGHYTISFFASDEDLRYGTFYVGFDLAKPEYIRQFSSGTIQFSGLHLRDTIINTAYHIPKKGGTIRLRLKDVGDILSNGVFCSVTYKYGNPAFDAPWTLADRVWMTGKGRWKAGELNSQIASEATIATAANQYSYINILRSVNGQHLPQYDSLLVSVGETKLYEVEY